MKIISISCGYLMLTQASLSTISMITDNLNNLDQRVKYKHIKFYWTNNESFDKE